MTPDLPNGTVTLLFTDIEGSTRLLQELGRDRYIRALSDQRRIVREAFMRNGGVEVEMQGDSFHFAFAEAREAVTAAAEAHRLSPSTTGKRSRCRSGSASTRVNPCRTRACTPASTSISQPGS